MAKGQMRTSKEAKKPKTAEKKTGPKYMMQSGLGSSAKSGDTRPGQKK